MTATDYTRGVYAIDRRMPLTEREQEMIEGLAAGETYAQIGARLGISLQTTKRHMLSLFEKLGAANGPQAVYLWCRADRGAQMSLLAIERQLVRIRVEVDELLAKMAEAEAA